MNSIDIVIVAILALAVYNGWKSGVIVQIFSLAGLLIGIYLAIQYGTSVGEKFQLSGETAAVAGFVIVLIGTMVAVTLTSRVVRKLFRYIGLSLLDIILGIIVSLAKYTLILSVLLFAFDTLNDTLEIVKKQTLDNSILYKPVMKIHTIAFDPFDEIEEYVSIEDIKDSITENITLDNEH